MRARSATLAIPVTCKTVETWRRQRERLAEIMGEELTARYFVWVDPAPELVPNAEQLDPVHEAKQLYRFMERNSLTVEEMRTWILVSEKEQRVIEKCNDLSLLSFTNEMIDFRREVWGEFLLLLERKEHENAGKQLHNDGQRSEYQSTVRV